ncbi:hypothetical protein QTP88_002289 [Uroleucon formosanum]
MSRNNTHYKRNLSSSSSSPTTSGKKCKMFVTPNRFAALDDGTASFPDVFSPPPTTDLSPVQGDSSNQTSTHESNNMPSHKAPTIVIKNINNFSKFKSLPAAPIIAQPARSSVIQFGPRVDLQIQIAPQIFVPDVPAGGSKAIFGDDMCMEAMDEFEDTG